MTWISIFNPHYDLHGDEAKFKRGWEQDIVGIYHPKRTRGGPAHPRRHLQPLCLERSHHLRYRAGHGRESPGVVLGFFRRSLPAPCRGQRPGNPRLCDQQPVSDASRLRPNGRDGESLSIPRPGEAASGQDCTANCSRSWSGSPYIWRLPAWLCRMMRRSRCTASLASRKSAYFTNMPSSMASGSARSGFSDRSGLTLLPLDSYIPLVIGSINNH